MLLFLNIISLYIEALVPLFHKPLKTSSIKFFGLLSEPGGDFQRHVLIYGAERWPLTKFGEIKLENILKEPAKNVYNCYVMNPT
jgi:hypothetical protein